MEPHAQWRTNIERRTESLTSDWWPFVENIKEILDKMDEMHHEFNMLENKVDEAVTGGKQCLGEPVDNGNGTYTSKKCGGCPCGEGCTCIKGPGLGKSVGRGGEPSDDDDMDLGPKRR